jgi:hypothetical protein
LPNSYNAVLASLPCKIISFNASLYLLINSVLKASLLLVVKSDVLIAVSAATLSFPSNALFKVLYAV